MEHLTEKQVNRYLALAEKAHNLVMGVTRGPWQVWDGPDFAGGGADLCIGAGKQWLANMDHREGTYCTCRWDDPKRHDSDVCYEQRLANWEEKGFAGLPDDCSICTLGNDITGEQRRNSDFIAGSRTLVPVMAEAIFTLAYDVLGLKEALKDVGDELKRLQEKLTPAEWARDEQERIEKYKKELGIVEEGESNG